MRQTLVRQKFADELPVPSDNKMIRLGIQSPEQKSAGRINAGSALVKMFGL
jgi:hypothetical protein